MQKERDNRTCFCRCKRKTWYAMGETSRLKKVSMQAMLTFAAMNVKKLVKLDMERTMYNVR